MNKEKSLETAPLPSSQSLRKLRDYELRVGFSLLPDVLLRWISSSPAFQQRTCLLSPLTWELPEVARVGCLVRCNIRKSSSLSPGGTGEL